MNIDGVTLLNKYSTYTMNLFCGLAFLIIILTFVISFAFLIQMDFPSGKRLHAYIGTTVVSFVLAIVILIIGAHSKETKHYEVLINSDKTFVEIFQDYEIEPKGAYYVITPREVK